MTYFVEIFMEYFELNFFKIGTVTSGGGPSRVPILKAEVVERREWIGLDDFMDALPSCPAPLRGAGTFFERQGLGAFRGLPSGGLKAFSFGGAFVCV